MNRRLQCVRHVVRVMETRIAYISLLVKYFGNYHLEHQRGGRIILRWILEFKL
jgi:hypothetical protein